jgi:NADH:ubiquinone oxidoreductase subunit 6 (subunit J)
MKIPAADLIATAFFIVCLLTTATGALLAVFTTRIIRSVCGLAITCFGLAGLYYFLNSPFLALMEILIYVGAVCVTIVFAVMLSEPDEPAREETKGTTLVWGGIALLSSGAIFFGLWQLSLSAGWTQPAKQVSEGSVNDLGIALLTTYSMPFEVISLALLVAIIGAIAIARTGRTKP